MTHVGFEAIKSAREGGNLLKNATEKSFVISVEDAEVYVELLLKFLYFFDELIRDTFLNHPKYSQALDMVCFDCKLLFYFTLIVLGPFPHLLGYQKSSE